MTDNKSGRIAAYHQVVILQKGDEIGVLALTRGINDLTMIGRSDRKGVANSLQTEGFYTALRAFENSIAASVDVGWTVAWRGFPHGRPGNSCGRCFAIRPKNPAARFCGRCGGLLNGEE